MCRGTCVTPSEKCQNSYEETFRPDSWLRHRRGVLRQRRLLVAAVSWPEQLRGFRVRQSADRIRARHEPALENFVAARRFIAVHLERQDIPDSVRIRQTRDALLHTFGWDA